MNTTATIPFIKPARLGREREYVLAALEGDLAGDGPFVRRAAAQLTETLGVRCAMLAPNCTQALELAALVLDIRPGDEVLMPSFTFVSTANAFALRGATPVWVDIRQDTLNIDETLIEAAITPKTRAIVVVHYAGVACDMDKILAIAARHRLYVIEDAAHAYLAYDQTAPLGTRGDIGCFSFHSTKNISCGEGGAFVTDNAELAARAEVIREKGTNRAKFFRGEVDRYTWRDLGSSYIMSDLTGAYLLGQLETAEEHTRRRVHLWNIYRETLLALEQQGKLKLPVVPKGLVHNAHLFALRCRDPQERANLLDWLKQRGIGASFHYAPLHSSPAGQRYGRFAGTDRHTTRESELLLRLPLSSGHVQEDILRVSDAVRSFY